MTKITKRARRGKFLTVHDIPPRRNLRRRFLGNWSKP